MKPKHTEIDFIYWYKDGECEQININRLIETLNQSCGNGQPLTLRTKQDIRTILEALRNSANRTKPNQTPAGQTLRTYIHLPVMLWK